MFSLTTTRIEFRGRYVQLSVSSPQIWLVEGQWSRRYVVALSQVSPAQIVTSQDDDGDAVFRCSANVGEKQIVFFEGRLQTDAEKQMSAWNSCARPETSTD